MFRCWKRLEEPFNRGQTSIFRIALNLPPDFIGRGFIMAEINKLSVGQALDKLRGTDVPDAKMEQLDGKIGELDAEIHRLRATRIRVERDQRVSSTRGIEPEVTAPHGTKHKFLWIIVAVVIVIVISIATWLWKSD